MWALRLPCGWLPSCSVFMWWIQTAALWHLSDLEALTPLVGPVLVTSSSPDYLQKAPSPVTVTMGVQASTYDFEGNTVQSIAATVVMFVTDKIEVFLPWEGLEPDHI